MDTVWQISSFSDLEKEINEVLTQKQMQAMRYATSSKLVVTDCDGCLTNGRVLYFDDGSRARDFSVIDGHGFQMLKENGFDVVILSGEGDNNIKQRAEKLGVRFIFSGGKEKGDVLKDFIHRHYVEFPEVYVLGDDIGDLSLFPYSNMSATPKSSIISKKFPDRVDMILSRSGGDGAFREFAEEILLANRINPYNF